MQSGLASCETECKFELYINVFFPSATKLSYISLAFHLGQCCSHWLNFVVIVLFILKWLLFTADGSIMLWLALRAAIMHVLINYVVLC